MIRRSDEELGRLLQSRVRQARNYYVVLCRRRLLVSGVLDRGCMALARNFAIVAPRQQKTEDGRLCPGWAEGLKGCRAAGLQGWAAAATAVAA